MVFVSLHLIYFIWHSNTDVLLLSQKIRFPSLLQPHSIPLYKRTRAFLPTHLLMGTWATGLGYYK